MWLPFRMLCVCVCVWLTMVDGPPWGPNQGRGSHGHQRLASSPTDFFVWWSFGHVHSFPLRLNERELTIGGGAVMADAATTTGWTPAKQLLHCTVLLLLQRTRRLLWFGAQIHFRNINRLEFTLHLAAILDRSKAITFLLTHLIRS